MKTENKKPLKSLNTPTRPCVPEDHRCSPTDCIPLSNAATELETLCIPDICDPAVKCGPQRNAGPIICIPTACGPDIPCTPEAKGREASQSTQATMGPCIPDMECDPGDVWSRCGPRQRASRALLILAIILAVYGPWQ